MNRDIDHECCDNCRAYSEMAVCMNKASDEYTKHQHKLNWCIKHEAKPSMFAIHEANLKRLTEAKFPGL